MGRMGGGRAGEVTRGEGLRARVGDLSRVSHVMEASVLIPGPVLFLLLERGAPGGPGWV